jgi:hypothetical protein
MLAMRTMEPSVFQYMMQFCGEGLKSSDSAICSQVAISVDYIFSFVVKGKMGARTGTEKAGEYLLTRMEENPGVVTGIMQLLLDLVFFDDHPSQWTFTRALLPLVLSNKEVCNTHFNA